MPMDQSKFLKLGTSDDQYIIVDDMLVDKKMHDIAEKINAYDEQLVILAVDPNMCGWAEAPYVLAEVVNTPEGPQVFKVFDIWELNDSVLERVYLSDTRRTNVLLNMDRNNQKIRDDEQRRYREKMESKKDLVASIIASSKSSYSYIDEERDVKVTTYPDQPFKVERKS